MLPQVIFINDSSKPSGEHGIQVTSRPSFSRDTFPSGSVKLSHGLFQERRELIKKYVEGLDTDKVFQNHRLEAGIRIDQPGTELHRGWEEPHCQLRGHFAGHWLSSMAFFSSSDNDQVIEARLAEAIELLQLCQQRNGGLWAGSIPEKYLLLLEQGVPVWSPQYTVHKTMAGLLDAYALTKNRDALNVLTSFAEWFYRWGTRLIECGKGAVMYQGECAGMLELWASLYEITHDAQHLQLAQWYSCPDLFQRLLDGEDPLSHTHTNAGIPWILGAARVYEVFGDERFRLIVEAFWKEAVVSRGMFATSGNNGGEYWIPKGKFGDFLGERTQEHCTVYNMIRVAQYLFRWTGEASYAAYIERALYNGVLAQQNKGTGLVCYFLPLSPGSRKKWGGETSDFWCCHGTLVQAPSLYENLIYHREADGISVDQFIPSRLKTPDGTGLSLSHLPHPDCPNDSLNVVITIESTLADAWTLYLRMPSWLAGNPEITVDGISVAADVDERGFCKITRQWNRSTVAVALPKKIHKEYLPGCGQRFALVDGPVVLAALTAQEETVPGELELDSLLEHQYVGGQEWKSGHYLLRAEHRTICLKPLHEITDEQYSVYFRER